MNTDCLWLKRHFCRSGASWAWLAMPQGTMPQESMPVSEALLWHWAALAAGHRRLLFCWSRTSKVKHVAASGQIARELIDTDLVASCVLLVTRTFWTPRQIGLLESYESHRHSEACSEACWLSSLSCWDCLGILWKLKPWSLDEPSLASCRNTAWGLFDEFYPFCRVDLCLVYIELLRTCAKEDTWSNCWDLSPFSNPTQLSEATFVVPYLVII